MNEVYRTEKITFGEHEVKPFPPVVFKVTHCHLGATLYLIRTLPHGYAIALGVK
jgi:hypothetical protein